MNLKGDFIMCEIKKQIKRILWLSGLSSFQLAGASWVALLAARGFSLLEIGLAESCFHLASLIFEIPSGVISDVFGRKKSMVLSQAMFVLSALCMAFSRNIAGVCIALVLAIPVVAAFVGLGIGWIISLLLKRRTRACQQPDD